MMKKVNKIMLFGIWFWLSVLFGGCGVDDKAIAIPIGGTEREETQASEQAMPEQRGADPTGQNQAQSGAGVQSQSQQSGAESQQMIYVHVCGAVNSPGVVELPEGSRGADALQAAGGFLETAQEDYVNLAEKLSDGQKLYFPSKEEVCLLTEEEARLRSGLVNINTADAEELCELPGIGSVRAQDIIAYREANGGFVQKEDLMKVSGIKESAFNKLCDKITVE